MNKWLVKLTGLILVALFISCAPAPIKEAPETKKPTEAPVLSVAKSGWEKEWERTAEEAKKEGKVVLVATVGPSVREALSKVFYNKFGITLEFIYGTGREISERLIRERKAGLYLADLYQGGVTTTVIILKPQGILGDIEKNLFLPELTNPAQIEKVWLNGKLTWVDSEHKILGFIAFPQDIVTTNTIFVKPEEIKSYRDLLNPKWKGKMAMFDPSMSGAGGYLFGVVAEKIMSMDYWREFARQEPFITRDHRQLAEWVARGKYTMAVAPKPEMIDEFIKEGSPLKTITALQEGVLLATGSGGIALIDKAPHPNAAKLFINWLLTREGATIYSKAYGAQSARLDVPTDFLLPERIRQPGVKYHFGDEEPFLLKLGELFKEGKEIFGIR